MPITQIIILLWVVGLPLLVYLSYKFKKDDTTLDCR